ncbi:MAG: flavohemoglobin expression-modulating QEGLA motif protein [Woeseiaceae bacterium]|nr:flavohemoglobin expression-modulating QEGLA motif protein [Woeseiaceae bacterium]
MKLDAHVAQDAIIVDAAKDIKVLSRLSWPADKMTDFLDGWHRGEPRLPEVAYPGAADLDQRLRALEGAARILETFDDPVADYLCATARSYVVLCELLANAGTRRMLEASRSLYGMPGDSLSDGRVNNIDAARHFLEQSDQYYQSTHLQEDDYCVPAQVIKEDLDRRLAEVFPNNTVQVVIDANLASKAAAGATRIRLRGDTCFTGYDLEQLLQHEAFVHSLTALNGRAQPAIRSLGLGAPRTTAAQEGLATFAELVTGAIDIDRMKRIALRVIAIDMALNGADFIEVFRFFLQSGQIERESFNSTMRIFRGAPLTGGAAFTKDVVYLHGLMEVHTFFRWALSKQRLQLCKNFFAGRMTIADTITLEPMFNDALIAGPKYLPLWMTRTNGLAGYLAFSIFANRISIDSLDEHHRFDKVQDLSD